MKYVCIGCGYIHITNERYMIALKPEEYEGLCEKCVSLCVKRVAIGYRFKRELEKKPLTLKVIGE